MTGPFSPGTQVLVLPGTCLHKALSLWLWSMVVNLARVSTQLRDAGVSDCSVTQ
eukprot:CAMPEP_0173439580 /NCGR_PEP_ID=MMETSP1357-20121228/21182_1 /TAXON_ID=77926 /ORGANISM="Hemiselmis rufescens, Strain PCC563" /LENGTH=53 /DNA_ID=CAMNT_0014404965 /DNA_START=61 /DNA_END=222 /DNA_ORIENTATION=+